MSDPEKPEVPARPKRDPAALSSEYHRAHKQLMLWSAILFIWELVGVDLSLAKDAGGYIGPIITAIRSPQAVPWVLLALVIYFLIKCSIEWAQCHVERRKIRFARIDFVLAWVVAVSAIALYAVQAVSKIQLANVLGQLAQSLGWPLATAIEASVFLCWYYAWRLHVAWRGASPLPRWLMIASVANMALGMVIGPYAGFLGLPTFRPATFLIIVLVLGAFRLLAILVSRDRPKFTLLLHRWFERLELRLPKK